MNTSSPAGTAFQGHEISVLDGRDVGDPEVMAMLQAMYSRSAMSIKDRMDVFKGDEKESIEERLKRNMQTYYVGYGHASIADMANVAVFVEGVSMLAAKALQDHPLYNGQERSTRYQDFGTVPYIAIEHGLSSTNERWRDLYKRFLPKVEDYFLALYKDPKPFMSEMAYSSLDAPKTWAKTVKAMAFDVCRSLLPCGATTSLSMYMSLRQFRDHIKTLIHHPLVEVRDIAMNMNKQLYARYPNSFLPVDEGQKAMKGLDTAYVSQSVSHRGSMAMIAKEIDLSDQGGKFFADDNDHHWYMISGCIDFGSFRDLQRHRRGTQQMPLVSPSNGFHNYYRNILQKVSVSDWSDVLDVIDELMVLQNHGYSGVNLQYGCPMGIMVPTANFWSLNQIKYVCELRSGTSVHPTMRDWVHDLYSYIRPELAVGWKIDNRDHYIQSNRGLQDIVAKNEGAPT